MVPAMVSRLSPGGWAEIKAAAPSRSASAHPRIAWKIALRLSIPEGSSAAQMAAAFGSRLDHSSATTVTRPPQLLVLRLAVA